MMLDPLQNKIIWSFLRSWCAFFFLLDVVPTFGGFVLMNMPFYDTGRGMHLLYKDVQSCQDEDVHVLWSILIDSHRHPALLKLKL
jgi:hypothetical protein